MYTFFNALLHYITVIIVRDVHADSDRSPGSAGDSDGAPSTVIVSDDSVDDPTFKSPSETGSSPEDVEPDDDEAEAEKQEPAQPLPYRRRLKSGRLKSGRFLLNIPGPDTPPPRSAAFGKPRSSRKRQPVGSKRQPKRCPVASCGQLKTDVKQHLLHCHRHVSIEL